MPCDDAGKPTVGVVVVVVDQPWGNLVSTSAFCLCSVQHRNRARFAIRIYMFCAYSFNATSSIESQTQPLKWLVYIYTENHI